MPKPNSKLTVDPLFGLYRGVILANESVFSKLPDRLQAKALVRLCDEAVGGFDRYPGDKMCRWLGFLEGVLAAVGQLDAKGFGTVPAELVVASPQSKVVMATLFDRYRSKISANEEVLSSLDHHLQACALIALCDSAMENFEKCAFDRINVSLGFVQGVLAAVRIIDVDEERDFSRPLLHSLHETQVPSFATDEQH